MRALLLATLLAGCGSPGPILEVEVSNIPPGTSDVRTTVDPDGPDETVRMIRWDGEDPFVYRVLFDLQGDVAVQVDAVVYDPDARIEATAPGTATLAQDTVARVDLVFP